MYNVGIVGLGFLGGSLAKSLSKLDIVDKIIAYDTNLESLKNAKNDGVITDYAEKIDDKFYDADVVFICTPVKLIPGIAMELEKVVNENCIITDTGSTKKSIIEYSKNMNREFIGGHPMIGSERSGYDTSKDFLFENAYYIITKSEKTTDKSIGILTKLIDGIRAIPIVLDENRHDHITASISHVPHIVAASLVNMVKELDDEDEMMKCLAAGGFKDITRIASSDPTMWESICSENKDEILSILAKFKEKISEFEDRISDTSKLYDFFSSSKKYRDSFASRKVDGNNMPELNVSIKDENGAIAKIATLLSENDIGIKNIEVMNNRENNFGVLKLIVRNYEER
nr:prephenate dehydrogenase [Clostridia bacterium]